MRRSVRGRYGGVGPEVARQARQAAEEEEEAAICAGEEATLGAEQEEAEAAIGAEAAQADMDTQAGLDAKKARSGAIWKGKLRRAHPRYTPDSTLAPGSSRSGNATALLDTLQSVNLRVDELFQLLQAWQHTPRGLPYLPLGHVRP